MTRKSFYLHPVWLASVTGVTAVVLALEAAARLGGEAGPSPFDAFFREASPVVLQVFGGLFTALFMAGSFLVYLALRRYRRSSGSGGSGGYGGYGTPAPWGLRTAYAVFIHWLAIGLTGGILAGPLLRSWGADPIVIVIAYYLVHAGVGVALIHAWAAKPSGVDLRRMFGPAAPTGTALLRWGLGGWTAAVPVVFLAGVISLLLPEELRRSTNPLLLPIAKAEGIMVPILFLFASGLGPLFEEFFFRGFVFATLRTRLGFAAAGFVSSFIFAVIHLDPGTLLPLAGLGLVLAYAYEKTGSLWPAVAIHGLWNAVTFIGLRLLGPE
ncbi:MAG: CPBP family intramembrane metalloprotease [Nitrospirae bacterium]|nr:CPBP family intramembrane metalloprotease [Nitrospirota bacterium]MBI3393795.1 CPBP family intramembrane metalloprotease [Nitrospirota bacterium]